jgi:hypothetical protein
MDYGQSGLVLLSPAASAERMARQRASAAYLLPMLSAAENLDLDRPSARGG